MEAAHLLEGEARGLEAEARKLEAEARKLEAEARVLEGDVRVLEGDARVLEGEAGVLEGEARVLEGEARGRRRHRTYPNLAPGSSRRGSRRGSMVAEQLEHRERMMMEVVGGEPSVCREVLTRTSSMAGRLAAYCGVQAGTFSRHSSDSGFHSQGSTASRAHSLATSRCPSRAGSRRSSLSETDSECSDLEPLVRVVPGGDVTEAYQLRTLLGEGAFSKVYLAESLEEEGGLAAVKVIDKRELCREGDKMYLVDKEIEIMSQLDHKHIVRLYEVYENETEVCLVMELAKGGELFDRLAEMGSLGEREAGRVMEQVLLAVSDLHCRGIVHRDLKPENLLFYDNRAGSPLLVVDFGLSEYEEELSAESAVCGTATYLAPEVISQTCSSRAQDLWSCGVIAYILLCGYPPFYKEQEQEGEDSLLQQIVRGRYQFHHQFWDDVGEDAKDFVRGLLVLEPTKRMTVDEALMHPWVRAMNRKEPGLDLSSILATTFLAILLLLGVLLLYLLLLSEYFNLGDKLWDRLGQLLASLSGCEMSVLLNSFYIGLKI